MTSFQQSLSKPAASKQIRALAALFLVIAFLGFLDATYLTVKHYTVGVVQCSLLAGCEEVTTSRYATVGPVPISLLGAAYYLLLFFLAFAYLDFGKEKILRLSANLTWIGFLASAVLVYLQVFVIKALCFYCLLSATASTLLLILGAVIHLKLRRTQNH